MGKNKEYIKGYELCRKLTREGISLYDYMDEHDVEWSKHFMFGWLDAMSQYYLDLKADTMRLSAKIDNEISELKRQYREIDKDTLVDIDNPFPDCPSCGNHAWAFINPDTAMCDVCGTILKLTRKEII